MKSAKNVFSQYLRNSGMLHSRQREQVLDIFLKTEKHLTIDDLYQHVRKKYPKVGLATVYRAMRVMCDAGLAREVDFGDGVRRFEHDYGHQHHYHLVCTKCGRAIEVVGPEIEKLLERLAKKYNFTPIRHSIKIFGTCSRCKRKVKKG